MIIKSDTQIETEALVHQLTEERLTYLKQHAKSQLKKSRIRFATTEILLPDPEDVLNSVIESVLMGCAHRFPGVYPCKESTRDMMTFLEWLKELLTREIKARVLQATASIRVFEQWKDDQVSFVSHEIDIDL